MKISKAKIILVIVIIISLFLVFRKDYTGSAKVDGLKISVNSMNTTEKTVIDERMEDGYHYCYVDVTFKNITKEKKEIFPASIYGYIGNEEMFGGIGLGEGYAYSYMLDSGESMTFTRYYQIPMGKKYIDIYYLSDTGKRVEIN